MEFAAELRSRQLDAWCAAGGDQLELQIQRPAHRQPGPRAPWHKRALCPLADFSDLCRLVEETGSRVAKAEFLTSYFKGLESDDDLRTAVQWLSRETPAVKSSPLNSATLRHALVAIPGARDERYREIHLAQKDLTRTARLVLQELQLHPEPLNLTHAATFLRDFREATASMDRIHRLSARLATLHPAEGETLVKLLTGDLRLGIDAALVEEALAAAFKTDPVEIHRAAVLSNDPGEAAVLARRQRLSEATAPAPEESGNFPKPTATATKELPFPQE